MTTLAQMFNSTLVKKVLMALTGLFLVLFLVGHLAGNLQLLVSNENDVARLQFNAYAHFMTTNPAVKILSYVTYIAILLHVFYALLLTLYNRRARPKGYAYPQGAQSTSTWSSRNMGVLGTFIFIFLIIHLRGFWYEMHWGGIPLDTAGNKDLYGVVAAAYAQWWYVVIYVLGMFFLSYHLLHGFAAAFQTLGFYHRRYTPGVVFIGKAFAVLVPILFALIPVVMYMRQLPF